MQAVKDLNMLEDTSALPSTSVTATDAASVAGSMAPHAQGHSLGAFKAAAAAAIRWGHGEGEGEGVEGLKGVEGEGYWEV